MKTISIKWNTEDVLSVREDLTEEQADDVLESIANHHDANIGVNWEVIKATADTLYPSERPHIPVVEKCIVTPRGTFKIAAQFEDDREAKAAGYGYYFTEGKYDIYTKHSDEYHCTFAVIRRNR